MRTHSSSFLAEINVLGEPLSPIWVVKTTARWKFYDSAMVFGPIWSLVSLVCVAWSCRSANHSAVYARCLRIVHITIRQLRLLLLLPSKTENPTACIQCHKNIRNTCCLPLIFCRFKRGQLPHDMGADGIIRRGRRDAVVCQACHV